MLNKADLEKFIGLVVAGDGVEACLGFCLTEEAVV